MKEKTKDRLKSWCMTLGFAFAIGLCAFGTSCDQNVFKTSAYSVNQQEESVTFSAEELNNCNYSYLFTGSNYSQSYLYYFNVRYDYNSFSSDNDLIIDWYNEDSDIHITINDTSSTTWAFDGDYGIFSENLIAYGSFFVENMQKSITLSASQLNNNTYEYFANIIGDENFDINYITDDNAYIIYNNRIFKFEEYDSIEYLEFKNGNDTIDFVLNTSDDLYCKFYYYDYDLESATPFTNSITIYSTYIHDNLFSPDQYQDNFGNALTQFVQIITSGLVDFATGVAQGIMSMATGLFLNNGSLSVFGGIVAIFAGLALAVGITTRVYTWVTSLGN